MRVGLFAIGAVVSCALLGAAAEPPGPVVAPPGVVDLTPPALPGSAERHAHAEPGEAKCYATTEFLLLHARRGDLDYAFSNPDPANRFAPVGSVLEARYPIDGGLRVGGGYVGPRGLWDASFHFTYFSSSDVRRTAVAPPGGALFPTQTRPGINIVDTAASDAYMRFRWYDLELARRLGDEEDFGLRVSTGLRFLTLEDRFRATYDGQDATDAEVQNRHWAYGTGILLGAGGEWRLGRRWRLDARGRGTLAYTYYTATTRETDLGGAAVNADATRQYARVLPILEFGLGIAWEAGGYRLRVGYELQNWFSAFDYPAFISDVAPGKFVRRQSDLGVEGVVFSLSKSF